MSKKIVILGAGLSGLSTAYLLKKRGISVQLLEARNRIGGRIDTIAGKQNTPMEMGATWLGKKHQHLISFLMEIDIKIFQQYISGVTLFETMSFTPPQRFEVPASDEPSFRIQGGTSQVIFKLADLIGSESITLQFPVATIEKKENHLIISNTAGDKIEADIIISTIPSKLFAQSIKCTPALPADVLKVFSNTQIWMENSIKFSVEYAHPFWKEKGLSGAVFSQSSLIPEMYDHTNFEENKYALKGFLNSSIVQYEKGVREKMVIQNLKKFFGDEAENHLGYFDRIWENEKYTYSPTDNFLPPHYNNGHPIYQDSYWDEALFFSGTETSTQYGGYMEGAIQSAKYVTDKIYNIINTN